MKKKFFLFLVAFGVATNSYAGPRYEELCELDQQRKAAVVSSLAQFGEENQGDHLLEGLPLLKTVQEMEKFLNQPQFQTTNEAYNAKLPAHLRDPLQKEMECHLGLRDEAGASLYEIIQQCGGLVNNLPFNNTKGLFGVTAWDHETFKEELKQHEGSIFQNSVKCRPVFYPIPGADVFSVGALAIATLCSHFLIPFPVKLCHAHGTDDVAPGSMAMHDVDHAKTAATVLFPKLVFSYLSKFYEQNNLSSTIVRGREGFVRLFYSHVWTTTAYGILDFLKEEKDEHNKKKFLWGAFCWIHESVFSINPHKPFSEIFQDLQKKYTPSFNIDDSDVVEAVKKIDEGKGSVVEVVHYFFDQMISYGQKEAVRETFDTQRKEIWNVFQESKE